MKNKDSKYWPNYCYYPDWEGGFEVGKHKFGKDGSCIFCGYSPPIDEEDFAT